MQHMSTERATHICVQNRHFAQFDYRKLVARMKQGGVKSTWPVQVSVEYSIMMAPLAPGPEELAAAPRPAAA